ncbi:MAG: hypothetical protein MUO62_00270 [Anaerolineales bacterium]|nr:hypothetical protein [Anaerolineales bacterium]
MQLTKEVIQKMMRSIHMTYPNELTCSECFEEVDRFAEMELTGKNAAEAMPLVKQHLERCATCKEEYEALMGALRAMMN